MRLLLLLLSAYCRAPYIALLVFPVPSSYITLFRKEGTNFLLISYDFFIGKMLSLSLRTTGLLHGLIVSLAELFDYVFYNVCHLLLL